MAIDAKTVMKLRARTGLGMMECKAALEATGGDEEAAIEKLRKELGDKMNERSGRAASEGTIAVASTAAVAETSGAAAATAGGSNSVAMIVLTSETDFAAKNDTFRSAAQKIADMALTGADGDVAVTPPMQALIDNLRITIKENISFGKGVKLSAPKVGSYVHHNGKVGVIITGEGDLSDDLLKGLCQHLVAADDKGQWPAPLAIDAAGVPAEKLAAAREAAVAEAAASGKPAQILEKIAEGKVRKWTDDHTLMGQIYIREMDAKKPVRDYIPKGAKITAFKRFEL